MSKPTDQIMRILAAGGGVSMSASKPTDQLVRLATQAAQSGGMLILKDASKPTDQLVRIAQAGGKNVIIDLG